MLRVIPNLHVWRVMFWDNMPVILSFCYIAVTRGSINSANNDESGHPCLVLQKRAILCKVILLVMLNSISVE